jgi:hypothetical protein
VQTSDAHVVEAGDVGEGLGRDRSLFNDEEVAGAGTDDGDVALRLCV